ncbi:ABC transporter ATP-binding protein [Allorhizobium taibaishanense]|uniref:ABC transporter ATP-binding protein n=1 Tax=Allorhizobium taibaishanense TaxID=887144 RepID=A0A1Q9A7S7_9HYPH|nr:ABC transporter ATP-binding protein [Allorhizobium taibaishanense]OLP50621.1 ABC transporter ATP-binding protein [Allorhizobium taibaishanense]
MTPVLELNNLVKTFGASRALDGLSLSLPDNSYISLLGPSGSGKTTLLRVIAGFERCEAGSIRFGGRSMQDVAPHRRGIGFVFQNFALFPHLSVRDNIAFGLTNRELAPVTNAGEIADRVQAMIALVGLTGLEDRAVTQISGGQKQRVALARTLVTEPKMVLLDEPLGALDANLRARMRNELREIRERCGVAFLHVTGSETEALAMGDVVLVLDRGRIAQTGNSDSIYNRPASSDVARFLNCYNLFSGRIDGESFVAPAGRLPLGGLRQTAATPAYAIRHDRIAIRPTGTGLGGDEAAIEAQFLAEEYTGSAVYSFFTTEDGTLLEVETHLSKDTRPVLEPQGRYALVWNKEHALVYA